MIIRCLCCGNETNKPAPPGTDARRFLSLLALLRGGHTIAEMTTRVEQIRALEHTSPGFVRWMRDEPLASLLESAFTDAPPHSMFNTGSPASV